MAVISCHLIQKTSCLWPLHHEKTVWHKRWVGDLSQDSLQRRLSRQRSQLLYHFVSKDCLVVLCTFKPTSYKSQVSPQISVWDFHFTSLTTTTLALQPFKTWIHSTLSFLHVCVVHSSGQTFLSYTLLLDQDLRSISIYTVTFFFLNWIYISPLHFSILSLWVTFFTPASSHPDFQLHTSL